MAQQETLSEGKSFHSLSEPVDVFDSDTIDYSNALRREYGRSQTGDRLKRQNSDYQNQVLTGFARDKFIAEEKNNNDVVFDVLPSFQLYNSLQHPSNEPAESFQFPPDYSPSEEESDSSLRPSFSRMQSVQTNSLDSVFDSNSRSDSYSFQPSEFDDADLFNKNLFDNIHRLPIKLENGLEIQIHVTKDVPDPQEPAGAESPLKEYTSGDVVHGYIDVQNKTNKPIQFQAFYVTLEGSVSIIDVDNRKQIVKQFLNMIDFSASWSFACISPSGNINFEPLSKGHDGVQLGLSNERILQPQSSARKFFTFKFPYNSLDTSCRHQQELHTLLPPSLGVNVLKKGGKYSNIEINSALNFGRLTKLGSPILTRDLSNRTLSVNYSINATMCGLKTVNNQRKLCVIGDNEYALRFIPFGFGVSLFSSRNAINQLKKTVEQSFKNAERSLKLLKEGQKEEVAKLDNEIKLQQLRITSNGNSSDANQTNFPLRNQNYATPDFSKIESGISFSPDSVPKNFLSNFKTTPSANVPRGFLSITTQTPKDGLPYISPSLIRKTNEVSKLTSLGYENLEGMKNVLSQNEKKKLASLKINFNFKPSNFSESSEVSLPKFLGVEVGLLVVNIHSTSSIPIKLSADVCEPDLFKNLTKDFIEYNDQLEELKTEFKNVDSADLKKYIHQDIISDIKSMRNLKNESYSINVFNSEVAKESEWELKDGSYSKDLEITLEFLNNIQETLIPNFQTCLLARNYFIEMNFPFAKHSKMATLKVPIRLRQFDGLS